MQKLNQSYINTVVRKALEEDLRPRGDITTNLITAKDKIIEAKIIAKQDGVIAGLDFCKTAFKLIGKESVFTKKISDGKKIKKKKVIAIINAVQSIAFIPKTKVKKISLSNKEGSLENKATLIR